MKTKKVNNKIGLALGSGGARGFFHVGVIEALRELGVEIYEISGVSIGAIVGLFYASNPDIDFEELINEFLNIKKIILPKNFDNKYRDEVFDNIKSFIKEKVDQRLIEDLKIKFSFISTSINSLDLVEYSKGKIFPYIFGSFAIPGIFGPIKMSGDYIIDGGVIKSVSLPSIKKCDKIIVSDVSVCLSKNIGKTGIIRAVDLSTSIPERYIFMNDLKIAKKEGKKVVVIENDTDLRTFDFSKKSIKDAIKTGYEYTMKHKKEILKLIKN